MDSTQQPSAPPQLPVTPKPEPALPKQPEKLLSSPNGNSWGAFIGIIIVVIVLIIGALYFWGAQLEKQDALKNAGSLPLAEEIETGK